MALSVLFIALGIVGNLPGSLLYAFDADRPHAGTPATMSRRRGCRLLRCRSLRAPALWARWQAARAVVYAVLYALAVVPGLPLGIALFGRRHPAAWIGGALLGYGLTQLARLAGHRVAAGIGMGVRRRLAGALRRDARCCSGRGPRRPSIRLPAWTAPTRRALLLVLLLVPVLMGPPYANLGRADAEGNRYYRAYFTADFLWHSALAFELGKFSLPPRNPYLAPRAMNYYWTYFLLPSSAQRALTAARPPAVVDVQGAA